MDRDKPMAREWQRIRPCRLGGITLEILRPERLRRGQAPGMRRAAINRCGSLPIGRGRGSNGPCPSGAKAREGTRATALPVGSLSCSWGAGSGFGERAPRSRVGSVIKPDQATKAPGRTLRPTGHAVGSGQCHTTSTAGMHHWMISGPSDSRPSGDGPSRRARVDVLGVTEP
jgi:hypothetical protein